LKNSIWPFLANSIFSSLCGLVFVFQPNWVVTHLFNLPEMVIFVLGWGLIGFAGLIAFVAGSVIVPLLSLCATRIVNVTKSPTFGVVVLTNTAGMDYGMGQPMPYEGLGLTDDIWLERVEDILYFETDERLDRDTVLGFGRRLREGYFTMLPAFAKELELVDEPDLYSFHADFLSRLALTFSHGDYAANPLIKNSQATAISLFKRSLGYCPDHRAYWGLGLIYQQQRRFEKSVAILEQGIAHHPDSFDLHMTLSDSLMRLRRYRQARRCLGAFQKHPEAMERIVRCYQYMGDREQEQIWLKRLYQEKGN